MKTIINYLRRSILVCFCMCVYILQAQQSKIDSLQGLLRTTKLDTAKVNILNALAREFRGNNPDTAVYYAKQAISLSEKTNFKMGMGEAYLWYGTGLSNLGKFDEALKQFAKAKILFEQLLSVQPADTGKIKQLLGRIINYTGIVFYKQGNFSEALKNYSAALKIRIEIGNKKEEADCYNNMGVVYCEQGNYPEALEKNFASLKIQKSIGNNDGIANSYNNIGLVYSNQGNYPEALKNYFASLKVKGERVDKKGSIVRTYNNIGVIYFNQANYPEALKIFLASLKIRKEMGDKFGMAYSYSDIGSVYDDQGNYSEALKNYVASLKIQEEIGDKKGIASSYSSIGSIYSNQGNFQEALKNHFAALKIQEENGIKPGIASTCLNIGSVYKKMGDITKAITYSEKSLLIAKEIGHVVTMKDASKSLFEIYKKQNKYKDALEMHELFVKSRDSIISEKNQKEIMSQQFKYDYDKKALADSLNFMNQKNISDIKNDAEHKAERTKRYALYAGLCLVIIFSLFIFNRFRATSKQKKIIQYQNFQIVESINYSQKIQASLLPSIPVMQRSIDNLFVLYEPKDIVSGDFYWFKDYEKYSVLACVDCTGHGVPGGFMSTLGSLLLDKVVNIESCNPSEILSRLSDEIIQTLHQENGGEIQDGMDLSICLIDRANRTIEFSGARNGIIIVTNGQAKKYKADLYPVGGNYLKKGKPIVRQFSTQKIAVDKNDWIYMYTDGFMEQNGGEKNLPMNYSQFENYLIEVSNNLSSEKKIHQLQAQLNSWRGKQERNDDVLIMGFQISPVDSTSKVVCIA